MSGMSFMEGVVRAERNEKPMPQKLTKRQVLVMALREKLPDITDRQRRWMMEEPFDDQNIAYYWKRGKVWCQNCGHVEPKGLTQDQSTLIVTTQAMPYVCPCCGKTMTLVPYNSHYKGYRKVMKDSTIVTHVGDYTVFRTFQACRRNMLGHETDTELSEIWENWVCPDGREVILAKDHFAGMYRDVAWNYYSEFKPKKASRWSTVYDVRYNYFAPGWKPAKILRRNGWRLSILANGVSPVMQMQNLLINPVGEMLVKTHQVRFFNYMTNRGFVKNEEVIAAVRICNRNRYLITDPSMWVDYIELLQYFRKDTRNAHYVCPQDLKREHDRLMEKRDRIEAEKKLKEQMKQVKRKEGAYKRLHGKFFGLCFGDGDIMVGVVSSVREMAEEGAIMHHCVFANRYYEKKDSLILSARDADGNRLETVEVNLRTWSIVQSRGKYNNPTARHDEILAIVNDNMNKIKKIAL
jgi:hypothetical protein